MVRHTVAEERVLPAAPDDLYHYWNERLWYPRFLPGVDSVEIIDEVWSRWTLRGVDAPVDVELTDNVLHHYVAWRMHQHHRERVSVWIEGSGSGLSRLRLEVSWRVDPDSPPAAGQQQRAAQMLDRFCSFVCTELALPGTSRAGAGGAVTGFAVAHAARFASNHSRSG